MSGFVLFNRVAELNVGAAGSIGTLISGLRISFSVKKTATPESNTTEVTVYNLAANTRNKFQEGDVLTLRAGYAEAHGLENLAIAEVLYVDNMVAPPDVQTTFVCKDGAKALRTTRATVNFGAGSTVRQVLKEVLSKFDLDKKTDIDTLPFTDLSFDNGYAFVGYATDALDMLTAYCGLTWSVQDGALKIVPVDATDGTPALVITSDTGLIGSPKRIRKQDKTTTAKDDSFAGWEITSLLMPKAEPGGVVELASAQVSRAQFKIVEVEHTGDTHDGDYLTVMKVREQ